MHLLVYLGHYINAGVQFSIANYHTLYRGWVRGPHVEKQQYVLHSNGLNHSVIFVAII
jgi:hypothetical protein